MRETTIEETNFLDDWLPFPDRAALKHDTGFLVLDRLAQNADGDQTSLFANEALALLHAPIFVYFEMPFFQGGSFSPGARARTSNDMGSAKLWIGNHLIGADPVLFDQNALYRLQGLSRYPLKQDPFFRAFEAALNVVPNSPFRVVALMSIVEGLLSTRSADRKIKESVSTKMAYFYEHVWPTLKLSCGVSPPELKKGERLADHAQIWRGLYKLRSEISHGQLPPNGTTLGEWKDGWGTLGKASWFEASQVLLHGVKSLIYWQLEQPTARLSFAEIA